MQATEASRRAQSVCVSEKLAHVAEHADLLAQRRDLNLCSNRFAPHHLCLQAAVKQTVASLAVVYLQVACHRQLALNLQHQPHLLEEPSGQAEESAANAWSLPERSLSHHARLALRT